MIDFAPSILYELPSVLREYIDANPMCAKHREHLELHVRRWDAWIQDRPEARLESDTALISAWLAELATWPTIGPSTVNSHRGTIIALIRFATADGDPLPRTDRIRRQKAPEKINLAFTQDEIRAMISAAAKYYPLTERTYGRGCAGDFIPRRRRDGIQWSTWFAAAIPIHYQSGQYLSDLSRIQWKQVGADGSVTFVRHKTGKAMSFRLDRTAINAAKKIGHPELLLPWCYNLDHFQREFAKFTAFAGVRKLEPKALRRSAITYTYISQGEEAARILAGHRSFATTAKHYIDWSIAKRAIVCPPPL